MTHCQTTLRRDPRARKRSKPIYTKEETKLDNDTEKNNVVEQDDAPETIDIPSPEEEVDEDSIEAMMETINDLQSEVEDLSNEKESLSSNLATKEQTLTAIRENVVKLAEALGISPQEPSNNTNERDNVQEQAHEAQVGELKQTVERLTRQNTELASQLRGFLIKTICTYKMALGEITTENLQDEESELSSRTTDSLVDASRDLAKKLSETKYTVERVTNPGVVNNNQVGVISVESGEKREPSNNLDVSNLTPEEIYKLLLKGQRK